MLWFVLGPGDPREASGGPGKGDSPGSLPGAPGPPRARVKKPKNPYFLQGPTERPSKHTETTGTIPGCHEMTLKLVSWDEFRCVLHHFLSWTRLEGPWGPIWPETDRKPYRFKDLAVLKAKIKIENFSIRAGIGPKPKISLGKWQSGPSPGTPRGRGWPIQKLKKHFKHIQEESHHTPGEPKGSADT